MTSGAVRRWAALLLVAAALFVGGLRRASARAASRGAFTEASTVGAASFEELGDLRREGRVPRLTPPPPGAPYDRAQEVTIHNAYERPPSLGAQLRAGVRSLEIDVHAGKRGRAALRGDWFVYHVDLPTLDGTRCDRLSSCLDTIAAFHHAHPEHLPMTIFVDLKSAFGRGHRPRDLDRMLASRFGRGAIVAPADLVARCAGAANAADAARTCGLPTLDALRGRVLFALTGGDVCRAGRGAQPLRTYAAGGGRLAFIAPSLDDRCGVSATRRDAPGTVFFNMDFAHRRDARAVRAAGLVGRIYYGKLEGGLDLASAFATARATGATFLATDRLDWLAPGGSVGANAQRPRAR